MDVAGLNDDPTLALDISGQPRPASVILKDVGCDEFTNGVTLNRPLTLADVGPAYLGGPNSQPPQITNAAFAGGNFVLSGTGSVGQPYRILAATNLTLAITNWTGISTGSFAVGIFSFTDLQTSNQPQRFYRVISP